jgi:hypothetical protein
MTPLPAVKFGSHTLIQHLLDSGYEFGVMESEEELQTLLLRRHAYVHAGKFPESTAPSDMFDPTDREVRVVIAKHQGNVVAAASIMLAGPKNRLIHENYLTLPADVPHREETVEVFKVCADPKHWGTGIFQGLLTVVGLAILATGRRYALLSAAGKLVSAYERFGMRRLNKTYIHPAMNLAHQLMLMDVAKTVEGRSPMHPLFWNIAGCWELWKFARTTKAADRSIRPHLWRLLAPVALLILMARAGRSSTRRTS